MMHSKDKACSSFQTITSNVHNHSITTSCIIFILLTIIPLILAFTNLCNLCNNPNNPNLSSSLYTIKYTFLWSFFLFPATFLNSTTLRWNSWFSLKCNPCLCFPLYYCNYSFCDACTYTCVGVIMFM